jgi:pimeloyl-ACP methyl ester carboxylesterase
MFTHVQSICHEIHSDRVGHNLLAAVHGTGDSVRCRRNILVRASGYVARLCPPSLQACRPSRLYRDAETRAEGKPWVWRARFPDYHSEMDVSLLEKGYHIAYVDVAGLFGSPQAVTIGDAFYAYVTTERGLALKPALEGVSRGGLFVYNWAARNPDRVACIYCDTPVCDFKSWPGGRGSGLGSARDWQQCLRAYGFNEAEALAFKGNPIDHAPVLAGAGIPLLHIVSANDRVVPPPENTGLLRQRLEAQGHGLEVISVAQGTEKSHGHHFDHPRPETVVDFVLRHTSAASVRPLDLVEQAQRIVFLGNSITYAGHYVVFFDTWLCTRNLKSSPTVINVGLPSETVSGLSEEGHAGGRFPRPDLAERLTRVLDVTQPDLVFACYGINCGIYQPLDDQRFAQLPAGY